MGKITSLTLTNIPVCACVCVKQEEGFIWKRQTENGLSIMYSIRAVISCNGPRGALGCRPCVLQTH